MDPATIINVLLVDDRPENLIALEAILEEPRLNLVKALSGEEALKCLLQNEFAAILLDVQMPGMDGFETAEQIRSRPQSQHTPIIFVTALSHSAEHKFKGYALGAVDYMVKPFEPEIMKSKVTALVRLYEKHEQLKQHAAAQREQQHQEHQRKVVELKAGLVAENRARELRLQRESQQFLQANLDALPNYIAILDDAGRIVGVNEAWSLAEEINHLIGASFDVGTNYLDLCESLPGHLVKEAQAIALGIRAVIASPQGRFSIEYASLTPGARRWFNVTVTRFEIAGAIRLVVAHENITVRKRAEENLRRSEERFYKAQKLESLSLLAGGIAHDFNNLLQVILGNTEVVLLQLPGESAVRQSLQWSEAAALRAAALAQQMLAFSGKGKFLVQPLDLSVQVGEVARMLSDNVPKQINFQYDLATNLPAIEADALQLRQMLMSLVTNAAEAIDGGGGIITIRTGSRHVDRAYLEDCYLADDVSEGDYAFVEIADDGCGIALELQAKLFEPFFSTKFAGRGLGLAAALGIVRGHRGAIKVVSEPGHGTTIQVLLPCVARPASRVADPAAPPAAPPLGSRTILVVDDEPSVRQVAGLMLEAYGFRVLSAADGPEAIAIFQEHADEIELVLLDLVMPKMHGNEVYEALCGIRRDVRVLLTSGYNEEEVISRYGDALPVAFIQKPYKLATLYEKVCETLAAALPLPLE